MATINLGRVKGDTGPQGLKGDTGARGPQGIKGDTGARGPQGLKGDTGDRGPQGEKGDTGAIPNISNLLEKSGDTLGDYTEKITNISAWGGAINLGLSSVFTHSPTSTTINYSINGAKAGVAQSFTLVIEVTRAVSISFPSSVKWQGGEVPDLTKIGRTYVLTFMTINGGTTWFGMFGGEF